jgi:integrase/recombinase XerC
MRRRVNAAKGWIDLQAGEAHVLGKGSKRRTVPVGSKAVAAVQHWLDLRGSLPQRSSPRCSSGARARA